MLGFVIFIYLNLVPLVYVIIGWWGVFIWIFFVADNFVLYMFTKFLRQFFFKLVTNRFLKKLLTKLQGTDSVILLKEFNFYLVFLSVCFQIFIIIYGVSLSMIFYHAWSSFFNLIHIYPVLNVKCLILLYMLFFSNIYIFVHIKNVRIFLNEKKYIDFIFIFFNRNNLHESNIEVFRAGFSFVSFLSTTIAIGGYSAICYALGYNKGIFNTIKIISEAVEQNQYNSTMLNTKYVLIASSLGILTSCGLALAYYFKLQKMEAIVKPLDPHVMAQEYAQLILAEEAHGMVKRYTKYMFSEDMYLRGINNAILKAAVTPEESVKEEYAVKDNTVFKGLQDEPARVARELDEKFPDDVLRKFSTEFIEMPTEYRPLQELAEDFRNCRQVNQEYTRARAIYLDRKVFNFEKSRLVNVLNVAQSNGIPLPPLAEKQVVYKTAELKNHLNKIREEKMQEYLDDPGVFSNFYSTLVKNQNIVDNNKETNNEKCKRKDPLEEFEELDRKSFFSIIYEYISSWFPF